jgi:hypothetical protein
LPELREEATQFEPHEWGGHMHFCEECQTHWRHDDSPECRYVDDRTCPEHEE